MVGREFDGRGNLWYSFWMERVKLFILVGCFVACLQALAANPLKLSDLVGYALEHSPVYKSSRNSLEMSELKLRNSFYGFFPSLDFQAVQGYRDGGIERGEWSGDLTLTLNSRLYRNGLNLLNYQQSRLEKERSTLERERMREQLCLELAREYFNYSLTVKISRVQNVQQKLLEKQFKSVEFQYKQGRKKRIDYVRFKARLQRARLGVQQANIIKKRGLEEIKRIMGWKDGDFQVLALEPSGFDVRKVPKNIPNFEKHYEYKMADLGRRINEYAVVRERKKYWPELFLTADASYLRPDYWSGGEGRTDVSALLTIKFNLWDWGERRRNVAIANLERMNKDNSLEQSLLSLKGTLNKLVLDIKQRKGSFLLNKELVALEKNNYATLEKNYRLGMTTFLDLINALNDYTNSQESWLQDFFQLKNLMAEYYFHQGDLYETIKNNY